MILCAGPGSEEESSSHEKMYFILREGPIHRCSFCGQCFKLVRLKDDIYDEANHYYSSVFTEISYKVLGSVEMAPWLSFPFGSPGDLQNSAANIFPGNRAFLFVNNDEADHIMVDPAYRMEKYKQLEEGFKKFNLVKDEIERQAKMLNIGNEQKIHLSKDVYERWVEVERAILKFDTVFNRYEKFSARHLFDPENHERRERRMLERKGLREKDNYTYYFGGLTESEQMYRDYYESDLENDAYPETNRRQELYGENILRSSEDFHLNKYQLAEPYADQEISEPVEDIISKSLFKYKYRYIADPKFIERNDRVIQRFIERAKNRDAKIFNSLGDRLEEYYVDGRLSQKFLDVLNNKTEVDSEFIPYAKYIAEEGLQQFKDYYETDEEEGKSRKELFEDLSERDKLRFAECYENHFNQSIAHDGYYVTIPKRPYDNKKSMVANFIEDLTDFNSRVRPIMRNLAFQDAVSKHQSLPMNDEENNALAHEQNRYRKILSYKKTGANLLDEPKRI
jgi:hypothetical protein